MISVPVHTLTIKGGGRGHCQKELLSTRLLSTTGLIPVAPTESMESRFDYGYRRLIMIFRKNKRYLYNKTKRQLKG